MLCPCVTSVVKFPLTQEPIIALFCYPRTWYLFCLLHMSFYSQLYLFLSPTQDCEVPCLCLLSIKPKALFMVMVHLLGKGISFGRDKPGFTKEETYVLCYRIVVTVQVWKEKGLWVQVFQITVFNLFYYCSSIWLVVNKSLAFQI